MPGNKNLPASSALRRAPANERLLSGIGQSPSVDHQLPSVKRQPPSVECHPPSIDRIPPAIRLIVRGKKKEGNVTLLKGQPCPPTAAPQGPPPSRGSDSQLLRHAAPSCRSDPRSCIPLSAPETPKLRGGGPHPLRASRAIRGSRRERLAHQTCAEGPAPPAAPHGTAIACTNRYIASANRRSTPSKRAVTTSTSSGGRQGSR